MTGRSTSSIASLALPIVAVLAMSMGGAFLVLRTGPGVSLAVTLFFALLLACFLNTELGLHIILLSMLLSPEIVVGGIGGISIGKPDVKGDLLVLRIEDLILTAVTLAWIARVAIFKELGLVRKTPLNIPILLYAASLIHATLLGVFLGNVRPIRGFFFCLKYIEYFVVFFITVNYVHEERQLRRLLATAFVTCAISSIMGIVQIPSGERVAAPFEGKLGEPNTFGGYLVLMLALVLGLALSAKPFPLQAGWYAFAGLIAIPLLYTLSRTSWLAAIPMILTLALLSPRRLILITGLGVALILGSALFPRQVVERFNYTFYSKADRGDYAIGGARFDTSTSARLDSWKQGFVDWTKRPFLGYGVTGFAFMDAQFTRILVESGLVGLAAFLWLLRRVLQVARGTYRRLLGTRYEGLVLGYLAGLVAMIIHGFGANTFIIVRIMEPFWFLTGLIVTLPVVVAHEPDKAVQTPSAPIPQLAPLGAHRA